MARVHETGRFTTPPQASELEALSREAFAMIPRELRGVLGNVVIQVVDFPDDETLDELDCVYLYRRPILDYWCETGDDLGEVIRHVLIHEIGHHFGFSDEDMERIEQGV
jgi:predicted Zn-dependent protease with MMP-like domain